MNSIFRSEVMSLCQIFIPTETAFDAISALGEVGCVQFRDLNPDVNAFQRNFVTEVRRCDELERQIDYIKSELKRDGIKMIEDWENLPRAPNPREIVDLESKLDRIEIEVLEISRNHVNLKKNLLELTELYSVLQHTHDFFVSQEEPTFQEHKTTMSAEEKERGHLGFVAGVISREKSFAFERMLWRIARGNIFLKRADLEIPLTDPLTGMPVYKTVFIVFYQGEQLHSRIKKICIGFRASIYACPGNSKERHEMLEGVRVRIEDIKNVINQSEDHRNAVLGSVCKELMSWSIMVKKTKSIYHTLNSFRKDVTQNCLIGEGWTPERELAHVQNILSTSSVETGSSSPSFLNVINSNEEPPTFFPTNKFTQGFQNLIDAYGVAAYREVNPALYSCITFPFLFAVMFGDLGHGLIMLLFALWMCFDEKRLGKVRGGEIWNIFFSGRYVILLLGLFAMYSGLLYNELFSISINLFGSKWKTNYNASTVVSNPSLTLNPTTDSIGVYPIGMDPVWQIASNKIIFTNSFKMKMSVIMAVVHMVFGISLSVANFLHFKKYAMIVLEFLPEVLFLLLLFGYLVFLVIFKWVKFSPYTTELANTPGCAPSVLIMFIDMMLFKTNTATPGCDAYMFSVQQQLQPILIFIALICIPWLLMGKPLYIQWVRKHQLKNAEVIDIDLQTNKSGVELTIETAVESAESGGFGQDEEEPLSEIWIHQGIHTVEYILSTVSHTASYLRLWALSLAHSELSEVLWSMVMTLAFTQNAGYVMSIGVFLIFGFWSALTIAIMVLMEGLSAFLHTLRLHWVEFMSKFYVGSGYPFHPFSFKTVLAEDEN